MYIYIYNICIYSYTSFLTFVISWIYFQNFLKEIFVSFALALNIFPTLLKSGWIFKDSSVIIFTDFSWTFSVSWKVLAC